MTSSLRLTLLSEDSDSALLYRGEVDGVVVMHLVVDPEGGGSVRQVDEGGHPVGRARLDLCAEGANATGAGEDFVLLASHLAAQWRKRGSPPREVRKYFC